MLSTLRLAPLALLLCACSAATPSSDAGPSDGAPADTAVMDSPVVDVPATLCRADVDCSDGVFCNGVERCAPSVAGANARGCVAPPAPPCASGQRCDEGAQACRDGDAGASEAGCDLDGDGVAGPQCGGMDCDDHDPDRYPGNRERCGGPLLRNGDSPRPHDEDCNPCTISDRSALGDGDGDADGYPAATCSNPWLTASAPVGCDPNQMRADSTAHAEVGVDCDDTMRAVNPNTAEVCGNHVDDNCDGTIDEDVPGTVYRDVDNDGRGDPAVSMTAASLCHLAPGWSVNQDDCDDTRAETYLGARELCDRRDNDCSLPGSMAGGVEASEDMDGDGHSPPGGSCLGREELGPTSTVFPEDDCDDAHATVFPAPGRGELAGVCDGLDNDCDPTTTELTTDCSAGGSCAPGGACVRRPAILQLAVGPSHACARRADGTVLCVGDNSLGQLGDGTTMARQGPVLVQGLSRVVALAAGNQYTCALRGDGAVFCWGANDHGQLGDGTTTRSRPIATMVPGLSSVVGLTAPDWATCALRRDGTALCWGDNTFTQLGDLTLTGRHSPAVVPGLSNVVELSSGGPQTCARRGDGSVLCWGDTATAHTLPTVVPGLSNVVELSASGDHACARRSDGAVLCWGDNTFGELGDGTTTARPAPTVVPGLSNVVQLATGSAFTCARRSDGAVLCWGDEGTAPTHAVPTVVPELTNAAEVVDGFFGPCSVLAQGTVYCWGQEGGLVPRGGYPRPTLIPALSGVLQLTLGVVHTCARGGDGAVLCWGANSEGQLGDATTMDRPVPAPVPALSGVSLLATGANHNCVRSFVDVATGDQTFCWGWNGTSQLGDGTTIDRLSPTLLSVYPPVTSLALSGYYSCALQSDHTVSCWGANNHGMVGDGTTTTRPMPTPVPGLSNVVQLVAGGEHNCALVRAGTAPDATWCWGNGAAGQLGDGAAVNRPSPVVVPGLTGVAQLAAGLTDTCALGNDGTVRCWGNNGAGQLGDGTMTNHPSPTVVPGLSGVVALAMGDYHSCALLADATLRCWGQNNLGQLGDGTTTNHRTPTAVPGLSGVFVLDVGAQDVCVRAGDGAVRCWGQNNFGQLGDGSVVDRYRPTVIWSL